MTDTEHHMIHSKEELSDIKAISKYLLKSSGSFNSAKSYNANLFKIKTKRKKMSLLFKKLRSKTCSNTGF